MNRKFLLKTLLLTLSISMLTPFTSKVHASEISTPTIVSESAIVVDYNTGEIIYEKEGTSKKFLASTTKYMTALLFAEAKQKTDLITYSATAKAQPPYTLDNDYMKPYGKAMTIGDTMTADTVMKGLLLFSGNDTAYMISDSVGGDTSGFSKMMNDKATEYGLQDTHYENPNGLPINGTDVNYSTAFDLSVITKHAFENEWIREVTSMTEATVTLPKETKVKLVNRNTELGKNGNIGGKTGVTDQAGTCFTGVYERDGRKLIGVVLKCDRNNNNTRFEDMNKMMDYSYSAEKQVYKSSGEEVGTVELSYKLFGTFGPLKTVTVPITLAEDVKLYKNAINDSSLSIGFNPANTNAWKVASEKTTPLTVKVKGYSTEVQGTIAISKGELFKANLMFYIATIAVVIIAIILLIFIVVLIKNATRNSKKNSIRGRRR